MVHPHRQAGPLAPWMWTDFLVVFDTPSHNVSSRQLAATCASLQIVQDSVNQFMQANPLVAPTQAVQFVLLSLAGSLAPDLSFQDDIDSLAAGTPS